MTPIATTAELSLTAEQADFRLYWRNRLTRRGVTMTDARMIVEAAPSVSLHEAVTLVDQGCPPETLRRILL